MARGGGIPERASRVLGSEERGWRGQIEFCSRVDRDGLSGGEGNDATTWNGTDVETATARAEDGGARVARRRSQGEWFWAIPGAREADLAGARRVAGQVTDAGSPTANGVREGENRGRREME